MQDSVIWLILLGLLAYGCSAANGAGSNNGSSPAPTPSSTDITDVIMLQCDVRGYGENYDHFDAAFNKRYNINYKQYWWQFWKNGNGKGKEIYFEIDLKNKTASYPEGVLVSSILPTFITLNEYQVSTWELQRALEEHKEENSKIWNMYRNGKIASSQRQQMTKENDKKIDSHGACTSETTYCKSEHYSIDRITGRLSGLKYDSDGSWAKDGYGEGKGKILWPLTGECRLIERKF